MPDPVPAVVIDTALGRDAKQKNAFPKVLEIGASGRAVSLRCEGFDEISLHGGSEEAMAAEVVGIATIRGCTSVFVHGQASETLLVALKAAGLGVTEDKTKV
jgi:hypothetical protein